MPLWILSPAFSTAVIDIIISETWARARLHGALVCVLSDIWFLEAAANIKGWNNVGVLSGSRPDLTSWACRTYCAGSHTQTHTRSCSSENIFSLLLLAACSPRKQPGAQAVNQTGMAFASDAGRYVTPSLIKPKLENSHLSNYTQPLRGDPSRRAVTPAPMSSPRVSLIL